MKNFEKYLPSKRITAFFIIPFLAIVIFFIIKNVALPEEKTTAESEQAIRNILKQDLKKDSDGDGVLDWEERLYKTDPEMKDTDGDGLEDGVELAANTDPLDPLNRESARRKEQERKRREIENLKELEKLNTSQKYARSILRRSFELYKSGLSKNEMAQQQAVQDIIDDSRLTFSNKFSEKDIKISDQITKEEFKKNFTESRQRIQEKAKKTITFLELDLFMAYFKTKDKKYLEEMKKNVEVYDSIVSENLALEVPKEIKDQWLEYVNASNIMKEIVETMSHADTDSIGALAAVGVLEESLARVSRDINNITLYFNQ